MPLLLSLVDNEMGSGIAIDSNAKSGFYESTCKNC